MKKKIDWCVREAKGNNTNIRPKSLCLSICFYTHS